MNQLQAARQAMIDWLAHPKELGHPPAGMEAAGEFDLHGLHYYMFRYQAQTDSPWLLGVCGGYEQGSLQHCGHVFSEMEPYDPATAQEESIAMVEMIRTYWMRVAQAEQQRRSRPQTRESLQEQLDAWRCQGEFGQIIRAIEAVPRRLWDYDLVCQLAQAYAGSGDTGEQQPFATSLQLLESVRPQGEEDPDWLYQMGYDLYYLRREGEAIPYFSRAMELLPRGGEEEAFRDDCQEFLERCEKAASRQGSAFTATVLLGAPQWDWARLAADLRAEWGIRAGLEQAMPQNSLLFDWEGMMAVVSLLPAAAPRQEVQRAALANYLWPQAMQAACGHKAQLLVAVMGQSASPVEEGMLCTKILAAACLQKGALGVLLGGNLFSPSAYYQAARAMKEGDLPVMDWIYFGLYPSAGGISAYTRGMKAFGKREIEVLAAPAPPADVRDFLYDMAYYVLSQDAVLRDGETIGYSERQKLPITLSQGAAMEGITVKIAYPEAENRPPEEDYFGILRLYRQEGDSLFYAECWPEQGSAVVHLGQAGQTGEEIRYPCRDFQEFSEEFCREYGEQGYQPWPEEDAVWLAVQLPVAPMEGGRIASDGEPELETCAPVRNLLLRDLAASALHEKLGWAGLGQVDAWEMGPALDGSGRCVLDLYCMVADAELSVPVVLEALGDQFDLSSLKIAAREWEEGDYTQIWPAPGEDFSL